MLCSLEDPRSLEAQKSSTGLQSMQPGSLYFCLSRSVCGSALRQVFFHNVCACMRVCVATRWHLLGRNLTSLRETVQSVARFYCRVLLSNVASALIEGADDSRSPFALIPVCCTAPLCLHLPYVLSTRAVTLWCELQQWYSE